MGLAPEVLLEINPKLVDRAHLAAGARTGRYRHKPGFGTLIEGYSGFASMNGFADREPVLPPMYLADCYAGALRRGAAMIALREVEVNGGKGQVIDLPLFDPLFAMLGPQAANYKLDRRGEAAHRQPLDQRRAAQRLPDEGRRLGLPLGLDAGHGGDACCAQIGRPELVNDPRFRTNIDAREATAASSTPSSASSSRARDLAENAGQVFDEAGVTIGPIYDIAQIARAGRLRARARGADRGPRRRDGRAAAASRLVPRLSGTPGVAGPPAPKIGEHNEALLKPLLGEAEYDKLREAGVVREAGGS